MLNFENLLHGVHFMIRVKVERRSIKLKNDLDGSIISFPRKSNFDKFKSLK